MNSASLIGMPGNAGSLLVLVNMSLKWNHSILFCDFFYIKNRSCSHKRTNTFQVFKTYLNCKSWSKRWLRKKVLKNSLEARRLFNKIEISVGFKLEYVSQLNRENLWDT